MKAALALVFLGALSGCRAQPSGARPSVVPIATAAGGTSAALRPCDDTAGTLLEPKDIEGVRLTEVCVAGATPETTAAVRKTMKLGPGKTLSADGLRTDLEAAYGTGLIEQIEARARDTRLFVTLLERPRISAVVVDGVIALKGDPVLATLPKAEMPWNPATVHKAGESVRAEYEKRGWDEVTTKFDAAPDGPRRMRLQVIVKEGTRARIGKVTFDGAKGGREVALRKAIELPDGAPLIPEQLERASLLVSSFYYDNGYLMVRVEEPKRTRAPDGLTAIAFKVDEGKVFRIGKVRVRGADPTMEKEILAGLHVKTGEVFQRSKLVADLGAIRAARKTIAIEPETELKPDATVDLSLVVQ